MKVQAGGRFTLFLIVLMLLAGSLSAQLCSGSLGDPVVNIDFGRGQNPGPPLPAGITNYTYRSNSCPDDGFYNIGTSTIACFGDTWLTVNEDHTPGDLDGHMMIINASNQPGIFYIDTAKGLCGGTTYEFAAWIMNIIKPSSCGGNTNKPNVTFIIESLTGENLLTYETGDISPVNTPEWKQFGAFFTTLPGTSSVVIRMRNNAPGGCGNDLLLDDITFKPCGAKVTSSFVDATDLKQLCIGDNSSFTMNAEVSQGDNNTLYQWQLSTDNGNTWSNIQGAKSSSYVRPPGASTPATYLYRVAVAQGDNFNVPSCRVVSNTVSVTVNALPVPNASNDGPKCEGDILTLSAGEGKDYAWTGPNGYTSNIQFATLNPVKTADAGTYYVTVTTAAGCVNFDSTTVAINTKVNANAGSDVTICEGSSTVLNGGSGVSYLWSPSAGLSAINIASPVASPRTTTLYVLTVSNGECEAKDTVQVLVLKKPLADAGPDLKMLQGQSVVLNGNTDELDVSIMWSPALYINNTRIVNPVVTPPDDITYTLTVTSNSGCGSTSDAVFVRVFKSIKIPNAFSPNGDGINDVWNIEALETYPEADVQVFNRFGQLVHLAKGTSPAWNGTYNGKPLPVGTYYYVIDVKNGLEKLSGSLLIVR